MDNLEDEKQGLIDLIEWYRDEYHHSDFCHTDMIEKIKEAESIEDLEIYWQTVDGWLDY